MRIHHAASTITLISNMHDLGENYGATPINRVFIIKQNNNICLSNTVALRSMHGASIDSLQIKYPMDLNSFLGLLFSLIEMKIGIITEPTFDSQLHISSFQMLSYPCMIDAAYKGQRNCGNVLVTSSIRM